ncbi:SurA N-terminal domain-containing protein [Allokutzneria sp. A3M-2-11 16]|uniref:SurA N-terminal domain-containing protein n=1 Tax=Allokutzneria sp. A3M-2-11 16 TaxID=2962043 RepID=UPI0020B90126|nr:SurA N-terminal domain-containing protein [Allokutzneria sp. A3M-2-11 16]MCP3798017.1 SurA N-terminal domain-containing protein [Allokutzneria sp. A3M-2-11 16]
MSTPENMPEPTEQQTEQPAKKKRSPAKLIIAILIPVAVIGFGAYSYFTSVGSTSKVGDCLSGNINDADSIKKAECGSGASYKIVGRIEDKLQTEGGEGGAICEPFPTAEALYWEGPKDGKGNFLCLEPFKA